MSVALMTSILPALEAHWRKSDVLSAEIPNLYHVDRVPMSVSMPFATFGEVGSTVDYTLGDDGAVPMDSVQFDIAINDRRSSAVHVALLVDDVLSHFDNARIDIEGYTTVMTRRENLVGPLFEDKAWRTVITYVADIQADS